MSRLKQIYSYEWGQNTVEAFTEKYARGTDFVCKMAGISHERLCRHLIYYVRADHQLYWEALKILIKQCQNEKYEDFIHVPLEHRQKYLHINKMTAIHCAIDILDEAENAQKAIDSNK